MTQIEINEKKYNLPESWEEITLGKFMSYYIMEKNKESDKLEYFISLLALLMECPKDEVEGLYLSDIKSLVNELEWLSIMPEQKEKRLFEIVNDNGEVVKYVMRDSAKLKAKEQITAEYILKDEKDNTLSFPILLAILLRPATEYKNMETGEIEYRPNELDEDMDVIINRSEIFKKKLNISEIYGPLVFFSEHAKKSSTKTMGTTSTLKITRGNKSQSSFKEKMEMELKKNSEGSGTGI